MFTVIAVNFVRMKFNYKEETTFGNNPLFCFGVPHNTIKNARRPTLYMLRNLMGSKISLLLVAKAVP